MNNNEREMWVMNDEGLYNWFRTSKQRNNLSKFVRENRVEIDRVIDAYLNGAKIGH